MKIVVLIDIDESVHGYNLYFPLVAELLRRHANDIETVQGAVPSLKSFDAEGHTISSTWIDSPHTFTARQYKDSPEARLMDMPKGPREVELKIK